MKRFDTINVIPFIDVLLVLLALVLVTATFVQHGQIEVRLPEAEAAPATVAERATDLALTRSGGLFLDGTALAEGELDEALARLPPQQPVVFRVDAAAPFAPFARVAAAAQRLGLANFAILTEEAAP